MPRSPSTYSLPPGTTPQQPNSVISSSMFNAFADDVAQTFNTVQPILYGGTGSTDLKLNDTDFGIKDNGDPTKIGQFNASGLPTATTRTYDLPYYSGTLGLVSDIRGYRFGLDLTKNGTDPANDVDMAAGSAVDSTGAVSILLASSMTKRVDATWVAGTNQGGRFYTTLVNGTIYLYLIRNPTTFVVDWGFSDNATTPMGGASYPAGFTQYALVGAVARVSGSNTTPYWTDGRPQSGTWTPGFNVATVGNLAVTWSSQTGTYIKIGRRVFLDFQFQSSSFTHTTASGAVSIVNLPFEANSTTDFNGYGSMTWSGLTKAGYTQWTPAVLAAAPNTVNILGSGSGVTATGLVITDLPTSGTITLRGTVSYLTVA